ncbi:MAG: methylmalonyl-CoA mutase family protein, partial [Bacilli bacterium]
AYESGIVYTFDPFGGSYYVVALTDEIERNALAYIERIDQLGGAVQAVEQGFMQREIHQTAYETQKKIESGEEVIIGLNKFRTHQDAKPTLHRIDPKLAQRKVQDLKDLREVRNDEEVLDSLTALKRGAVGNANTMPLIIDAVRKYATIGEICDVLREVFGEYQST